MIRFKFRVTLLILLAFTQLKAQDISFYVNSNKGILAEKQWISGQRGGSLGLNYSKVFYKDFNYLLGSEFSLTPWGTDVHAILGLGYSKAISPKWMWSIQAFSLQGLALFRPKALFVAGLSAIAGIEYQLNDKLSVGLSTGLKYYTCPAYKQYSLISEYLDIPIQLSIKRKLTSR
jgi:hypothetical protein